MTQMLGCGCQPRPPKYPGTISMACRSTNQVITSLGLATVLLAVGSGGCTSKDDERSGDRNRAPEQVAADSSAGSGMAGASINELRRMSQAHPNSAYVRYLLGVRLREGEQCEEAIQVLEEAIALDEALVDAYFELAWCYHSLRKPLDQVRVYERLLGKEENLPTEVRGSLHTYIGNSRLQLAIRGDEASGTRALEHYRTAQLLTPDAHGPILGEGRTLIVLQRWKEAEATFRRVLQSTPGPRSEALAYEGLANVAWYARADRKAAEQFLAKARQADPTAEWAIREFLAPRK